MAAISTGTGTFAGGCAVSSSLRAKAPRTERNRRERCRRERKLKPVAAMGAGDFKRRRESRPWGQARRPSGEQLEVEGGRAGKPARQASRMQPARRASRTPKVNARGGEGTPYDCVAKPG